MLLNEQLAQGGTAVGTGLNTKKGYACLITKRCFLYFTFMNLGEISGLMQR